MVYILPAAPSGATDQMSSTRAADPTVGPPPAEVIAGMREVAHVSTPITDEDLEGFVTWAEATFGEGLAAQGDGKWITLFAPSDL